MSSNYSIRKAAAADLEEVLNYVFEANPKAAIKLYDRFEEIFEMLAVMPKMGRLRPELGERIRSLVEKNYSIYFQVLNSNLEIVRVLHNRRDIDATMFD